MKIILSRKGFDSSNGGCASPIMPDGTLLSLPIPDSQDKDSYADLCYNNETYADILHQLRPKNVYSHCHIDPDIRDNCRVHPIDGWSPAFGQQGSAQGVLAKSNIEKGDIFLFFGWFRRVEKYKGQYRFITKLRVNKDSEDAFYQHSDLHVIHGYLQIGEILKDKADFAKYPWHPHSAYATTKNALYIPNQTLSLNPALPGYGTLTYRQDRVLTKENSSKATWNALPFLLPDRILGQHRKNSAKDKEGLYYSGIWQELVFNASDEMLDWVKSLLS